MGYHKHVGRVGALALALGVGLAVATPAWADDGAASEASESTRVDAGPKAGSASATHRKVLRQRTNGAAKPRGIIGSDSDDDVSRSRRASRLSSSSDRDAPRQRTVREDGRHDTSGEPADSILSQARENKTPLVTLTVPAHNTAASVPLSRIDKLLDRNTDTPAANPTLWVVMAAARREIGSRDFVPDNMSRTTAAMVTPLAAPKPVKTVRFDNMAQLTAAIVDGVVVPWSVPWDPTYWSSEVVRDPSSLATTQEYDYDRAIQNDPNFQAYLASTSATRDRLASEYTAWVVRTPFDSTGTILGATRMNVGDMLSVPMTDESGNPLVPHVYYVAMIPSNIRPVFPELDTTPPSPPTLTVSSVSLTTVAVSAAGGYDEVGIVGYNIYRDGFRINFTTPVAANATIVDTYLSPDTTYVYVARAVDAAGNESSDSAAISVTTDPLFDTSAPTIIISQVTSDSVTLIIRGGFDIPSAVAGYNVYRDGKKINNRLVVPDGEEAVFFDWRLKSDVTYHYTVRAVNLAGEVSDESRSVTVTTFTPAEEDSLMRQIIRTVRDYLVPDQDESNTPLEVWWESTNNIFSLIPGAGIISAIASVPVNVIQWIAARASGNQAGMEDEVGDIRDDLFRALQPLKGGRELIKRINDVL